MLVAPADHFGNFFCRLRKNDDRGFGLIDGVGVAVVGALGGRTRENLIWTKHGFERREVHEAITQMYQATGLGEAEPASIHHEP